jgi:hypothetical protein
MSNLNRKSLFVLVLVASLVAAKAFASPGDIGQGRLNPGQSCESAAIPANAEQQVQVATGKGPGSGDLALGYLFERGIGVAIDYGLAMAHYRVARTAAGMSRFVLSTGLSATILVAMQTDNLISLKDDMVAFIAGHGMRRFNGYITEEVPTVIFEDEDPDSWKDFVEHAKAAGATFVTMSEVTLEKSDIAILLEQLRDQSFPDAEAPELDDAEYLVNHVGKLGYLQLGFAYQGVMFLFETSTEWYERFQELIETVTDLGGIVVDDRDDE